MQRRPTSFDIAALAGVSQPTVSRALSGNPAVSEATRTKVLEAAKQLNYKVDKNASGLRGRRAQTLALLFSEDLDPQETRINQFYLSMLGPMVRRCAEHGFDLLISSQQLSDDWVLDYEHNRKADGLILLGYGDYLAHLPRIRQLIERGSHFVRWGHSAKGQPGVTVSSDNEGGGYQATRHLIDQGRRAIAFVGNADNHYPEYLERYRGYCRALREANVELDADLSAGADAHEGEGRAAAAELLGKGKTFDAIFAASDIAAIGAMHELQDRGITVPDDVAIVGFDDISAASLSSPPLTTVAQDPARAGEALIDAIIEAIECGSAENRLLPVKLKVRKSSGA